MAALMGQQLYFPPSTGGSGGHIIEDEGTPLTSRASLNFTGSGVACTDDSGNNETDCAITSGTASPLTTKGDIWSHNGSADIRFPVGGDGLFLRANSTTSSGLEYVSTYNIDEVLADVNNSSNVTATTATDIAFVPGIDTWAKVACVLVYRSAATTTGIGIGLYANNVGGTANPQAIAYTVRINGITNDTAGTTSATEFIGHGTSHADLVISNATFATATDFTATIDGLVLTHATDATFFISVVFRSEVNASQVTLREGSSCELAALHPDV